MKLKIKEHLHNSNDEFADWELKLGDAYLQSEAAEKLHYRLYELEVDLEVDTETGEDRIIEIRYGEQVLRPVEKK